ncbi:MAG: alpha/beta fold hydrolase [Alphaproteobacteria bacterium]
MPHAVTDDGVKLYYEEAGSGFPVIFVHEYAGDHRSWEPQMRFFSHAYRTVAYNARGYPPSDVPEAVASYSQERAADDIAAVLKHLGIAKAHVVGLSMGGFATLHFGLRHAALARSLVVAGCGYGAESGRREVFLGECEATAAMLDAQGSKPFAAKYALGAARVQYQNKDPRGWREFADQLAEHSAKGAANTMRGVQMKRPSLWDLVDGMKALTVPTLIVTGDEDEPCLEPGLLMKRAIPSSGLVVMPKSGHTINLEEPDAFNRAIAEFFHAVENGRWGLRDPRSLTKGVLGLK